MLHAARAASELALQYFQSEDLQVQSKGEAGPVTQADREAEELIRHAVHAQFPLDGLLGEEFGAQPGSSEFYWVIDPIDGTVSFAAGVPLFGTLLALEQRFADGSRRVVAGVCHMPALGESVWAVEGCGAWWHRQHKPRVAAKVIHCTDLKQAIVCTTGSEYYLQTHRLHLLTRLEQQVGRVRGWSDCYALMLLATGRCHVAVDPLMHPWDCAPFEVIVREAGGVFTDWLGNTTIHGGDSLACHTSLHASMLELLRG